MPLLKGKKNIGKNITFVDGFGFKKDSFELIEMDDNGYLTRIPFLPDLKVKIYSREDDILHTTQMYTDEDYCNMLSK